MADKLEREGKFDLAKSDLHEAVDKVEDAFRHWSSSGAHSLRVIQEPGVVQVRWKHHVAAPHMCGFAAPHMCGFAAHR